MVSRGSSLGSGWRRQAEMLRQPVATQAAAACTISPPAVPQVPRLRLWCTSHQTIPTDHCKRSFHSSGPSCEPCLRRTTNMLRSFVYHTVMLLLLWLHTLMV